MRQDLQRVRNAWTDCQASRDRDAIYAYLSAVYGLVAWWAAEGREVDRSCRALGLRGVEPSTREDPFAAIIQQTRHAFVDPSHIDAVSALGQDWRVVVPVALLVGITALGLRVFTRLAPSVAEEL